MYSKVGFFKKEAIINIIFPIIFLLIAILVGVILPLCGKAK